MSATDISENTFSGCNQIVFSWVKTELFKSIENAQNQFARYIDNSDKALLEESSKSFSEIVNTLKLINLYGASMLANEIRECMKMLLHEEHSDQNTLRAVIESIIQVHNYLERIERGAPDVPVALLPYLNELRAAQQATLLSESAFFLPKLQQLVERDLQISDKSEHIDVKKLAQLREGYHISLLAWFKNIQVDEALKDISKIMASVASMASKPVARLFHLASVLSKLIIFSDKNDNTALKLVLGKLDSEMRLLLLGKEEDLRENFPIEKMRNLLFYLGSIEGDDFQLVALKKEYQLDKELAYLSQEDDEETIQDSPSAYEAVADELMVEIKKIKDMLDIFSRSKDKDVSLLSSVILHIRQLSDTLGMLGFGIYRESLRMHIDRLQDLINSQEPIETIQLNSLAEELLIVESLLPNLFTKRHKANEQQIRGRPAYGELSQYVWSAIKETVREIAILKDGILLFKQDPREETFERIKESLTLVSNIMHLLGYDTAVDLLARASEQIISRLGAALNSDHKIHEIDSVADVISGIEYYLEVAAYACTQEEEILYYVRQTIEDLEKIKQQESQEAQQEQVDEEPEEEKAKRTPEDEKTQSDVRVAINDGIDDETREIFREECREQLEIITKHYPQWQKYNSDLESLKIVRRAFHTLKGSGRMVGEYIIGEFAWEIENLLNHIIDGVCEAGPEIFSLLDDVLDMLPAVLDGTSNSAKREQIEQRARAFSSGVFGDEVQDVDVKELKDQKKSPAPIHQLPKPSPSQKEETEQRLKAGDQQELSASDEGAKQKSSQDHFEFDIDCITMNYAIIASAFNHGQKLNQNFSMSQFEELRAEIHKLHSNAETIGDTDTLIACKTLFTQLKHIQTDQSDELIDKFQQSLTAIVTGFDQSLEENKSLVSNANWQKIRDYQSIIEEEPDLEHQEYSQHDELTGIFLDEAQELTENMEKSFGSLSEGLAISAANDLKRNLHTLKGAARLSGQALLGDFIHGLETMLIEAESNKNLSDPAVYNLSRRAMDHIYEALDKLRAFRHYKIDGDLLKELESLKNVSQQVKDQDLLEEQPKEPKAKTVQPELQSKSKTVETISANIIEFPRRGQLDIGDDEAEQRVRVNTNTLNKLVDGVGEILTFGSRLQQQRNLVGNHVIELDETLKRLRNQLRQIEIETESQILSGYQKDENRAPGGDFDPLEMDQYTALQELSRGLNETVNDLSSISSSFDQVQYEVDQLLTQHLRLTTDLQDVLLQTRTLSFNQYVTRLSRLVRQTCNTINKEAVLVVGGEEEEVDRSLLNRIIPLIEHLLRNAIYHGIESPDERLVLGKKRQGRVSIRLHREGMELVIRLSDDGKGFDTDRIIQTAIDRGLLSSNYTPESDEILRLTTLPGFSTTETTDQISGRGIGLDIVVSEIENLGGRFSLETTPGKGSGAVMRFPVNIVIMDALMIKQQDVWYAIPSTTVDSIVRISTEDLQKYYKGELKGYQYAKQNYTVQSFSSLFGDARIEFDDQQRRHSLILVSSGEEHLAIHPQYLRGHEQVVLKSVGRQLASLPWVVGGAVMGDGNIAIIIDPTSLISIHKEMRVPSSDIIADQQPESEVDQPPLVLVVDDSITMRKITTNLLEKHGYAVRTAKDGVDAIINLDSALPDLIVLDIEMPRMDGFEFTQHVRGHKKYKDIPIVMVTSRTGHKHRQRAENIGVNEYIGKPFQEEELTNSIKALLDTTSTHKSSKITI